MESKLAKTDNSVALFSEIQKHLTDEQTTREDIRTRVKQLEQSCREIYAVLQAVHQYSSTEVSAICHNVSTQFGTAKDQLKELESLIPANSYYKFHDHWRNTLQRLVFLTSLTNYLMTGKLLSRAELSERLGIAARPEDGFHLDLEDYLMGILTMTSELARLAVNSVTLGNYTRPLEISEFVSSLSAGFQLLNLKNDALRRKFDSLKYDLKKIEEVVYDISIRGLNKPA
ncbi:translin-like isoform X2 [Dysidea avara]|uniref:translin-like isoform X2 n=1 Tax=Dysidea avara TaxID=196820 RepID=UPI00332B6ED7